MAKFQIAFVTPARAVDSRFGNHRVARCTLPALPSHLVGIPAVITRLIKIAFIFDRHLIVFINNKSDLSMIPIAPPLFFSAWRATFRTGMTRSHVLRDIEDWFMACDARKADSLVNEKLICKQYI